MSSGRCSSSGARSTASAAASWGGWLVENRTLADWLRTELAANGPMPASAIEHDANERRGPWWGWSDVKRTLEWMFRVGEVVCVERRRFERIYALPEQALAPELLDTPPSEADAVRELVGRAAAALGIATEADLADYWRMKRAQVRQAILDLEEAGELIPVTVPGWSVGGRPAPTWLHRDARRPRRLETAAVLSPFDPVVWVRPRTERLFDFHYRIEIYTPEPERKFGYYSLPVLVDDDVVGRVDLKSDRKAGVLRVQSAWAEPGAPDETAARLVPVLRRAASWQGLDSIEVAGRGDLRSGAAIRAARVGRRALRRRPPEPRRSLERAAHLLEALDPVGDRRVGGEQPVDHAGLQRVGDPQVGHRRVLALHRAPVDLELLEGAREGVGMPRGDARPWHPPGTRAAARPRPARGSRRAAR